MYMLLKKLDDLGKETVIQKNIMNLCSGHKNDKYGLDCNAYSQTKVIYKNRRYPQKLMFRDTVGPTDVL
jgi:hypothetical protein